MKKDDEVEVTLKAPCPCGGIAMVGRAIRPGETEPETCVLHSMPYCNAFETKEPDEYLKYVRLSLTN